MKKGFTLSEVLITLGIIGVVAAMTLPALVAKYQKIQTVNQLKKAYNVVGNAIQKAKAEYGDTEFWDLDSSNDIQASSDFAHKYLIPYLDVVKNCETDTTSECLYTLTNSNGASGGSLDNFSRFVLNDGTLIFVMTKLNSETSVFPKIVYLNIDINGFKEPNKRGKDHFEFAVVLDTTDDMFRPLGRVNASGQSQDIETIKSNCSENGTGSYCSSRIILNNWQIPDDYPW